MRGDSNESNTFHLFIQSPTHIDDNIHKMVSGSWVKSDFRTFLSGNHSDYLIDSFNSSSISTNVGDYPDYVVKSDTGDGSSFYGFNTSIHLIHIFL